MSSIPSTRATTTRFRRLMISAFVFVLVVVGSVEAQATTTRDGGSTTTSSSSAPPATKTVAVGASGFKFEPNNLTAQVGDTVVFRFYPGGHSVVRSEFGFPCIPYELTGINHIGFFSNHHSPNVISNNLPTFSVKINDTEPIFFYCSAPGSCKDHYMIGAINPNSTQTLEKQEELVRKPGTLQLAPGEAWPSEQARPSATPSSTSTPVSDPNAGANSGSSSSSSSSSQLPAGAIAGIAIGSFAALVLAGALIFICGRKSRGPLFSLVGRHGDGSGPSDNAASAAPPGAAMSEGHYHPHHHVVGVPTGSIAPASFLDAKYGPNSPGHESVSTTGHDPSFSGQQHQQQQRMDPYRAYYSGAAAPVPGMQRQQQQQHPGPPYSHAGGPLPMSDGSYPTYNSFPSPSHSPLMGGFQGGYQHDNNMGPHTPSKPPAELPTSSDPGNSPLPQYSRPSDLPWGGGRPDSPCQPENKPRNELPQ